MNRFLRCLAWTLGIALALPLAAQAHAFPKSSQPAAGEQLEQMPRQVSITFDSQLEPRFSKIVVTNESGAQVSAGNGDVSEIDRKLLVAKMDKSPAASAKGRYHVHWDVVSHDGHRSEGDFDFTIR